ncbi:XRE family transcriptional regulator [Lactococcus protaetiae]|uniref:Helix-turn-helix transcriptional regulator n=1 Tax=Lactococcus protaetiae TaxID=2592653 RepID=A0A514ZB05_9LACT|nr:helix-turn-helix domain-containing protein [Lactococcus protaetiae]MCL2112821.1 helix-turn-helix domain-containing protein [Streptococcaceae bacterium]QDK71761.1 helix-turn-helix transcriptional regulator [Lactococcus protaetiae]
MFYDRLKKLVTESHKSFNRVERELGYPRNALANYRLGKEPSAKRLTEIADYFGVTSEYLLGKDDEYSYKKAQLLFDGLDEERKQKLLEYIQERIDVLKSMEETFVSLSATRFVYCGNDTWTIQSNDRTINFPVSQLPEDYDAVFELVGGALEPTSPNATGNLIFIKYDENNQVSAVHTFQLDHEHYAKLLTGDGKVFYLNRSDNTEYEDVPVTCGKIGKVYHSTSLL